MAQERPEVHLRVLTADDAAWLVEVDHSGGALARRHGWDVEGLAAELDAGHWVSDGRFGWAIVVEGEPAGYALVEGLDTPDADLHIRVGRAYRGRGVGREVLRQLADHHFASHDINRLVGRTHEQNVPMQRAFNAAGFRMEARYRESFLQPDGRWASEWGYALTRADWEAGHHRAKEVGYDLHGLSFLVEDTVEGRRHTPPDLHFSFLQEGRRVLARYGGGDVVDGELAGILVNDVLVFRYVHEHDTEEGHRLLTGHGRARLQRKQDGRLEMVNDWSDDEGRHGQQFLVERRAT